MIRRPPRSTLFPTRRSSDLVRQLGTTPRVDLIERGGIRVHAAKIADPLLRSEEHTSELQSRRDLVCRLLLEKKNKIRVILDAPPANTLRILIDSLQAHCLLS